MASFPTTSDNPYNPFKDWDRWYQFDEEKGYHTCQYLAKLARVSSDLTDEENDAEIERAIDQMCALKLRGDYIKVSDSKEETD